MDSRPYVIAPSFVKLPHRQIAVMMLKVLEVAGLARTLVIVGCGMRREDSFLWLLLTRFLARRDEKRLVLVDPAAAAIADRIHQYWIGDLGKYAQVCLVPCGLESSLSVLARELRDKEKGLAAMYSLLSRYGTHATFEGFQLVSQNKEFFIGPFEAERLLKAILEEACKTLPYVVVIYLGHWRGESLEDWKQKLHFFECVQNWWKRYMNLDFKPASLDEIKAMISALERRPNRR